MATLRRLAITSNLAQCMWRDVVVLRAALTGADTRTALSFDGHRYKRIAMYY